MKILIISYYFGPENTIAAIRLTKLGKYLSKGNFVTVICGPCIRNDKILEKDLKNIPNIIRVENVIKMNSQKKQGKEKKNLVYKSLKFISYLLFNSWSWLVKDTILSYLWFKKARKKLPNTKYDVVIASYGPIGSLLLGNEIKKAGIAKYYIADIRDPIIPGSLNIQAIKYFLKRIEQRTLEMADAFVCVSEGLLEQYRYKSVKKYVITNGFDQEDLEGIKEFNKENISNIIKFIYAGSLYKGKSDISILIEYISNFNRLYRGKKYELIYLGNDVNIVDKWIKTYNAYDYVKKVGFVDRTTVLNYLYRADVLVMATWNYENEKGILTGKIFEYLMFRKPILCFISGNKGAEVEKILGETKCGLCFYNNYDSIEKLAKYIQEIEHNFQPELTAIDKYSYRNIVEQYLKVIKEVSDMREL